MGPDYKNNAAFILTKEQFTIIDGTNSWKIKWLNKEERKKLLPEWLQFPDTEHVAISGSLDDTRIIDGIEACGGIDRIRFEKIPNVGKGRKANQIILNQAAMHSRAMKNRLCLIADLIAARQF